MTRKPSRRSLRQVLPQKTRLCLAISASLFSPCAVWAAPQGGVVTSGSAVIGQAAADAAPAVVTLQARIGTAMGIGADAMAGVQLQARQPSDPDGISGLATAPVSIEDNVIMADDSHFSTSIRRI